MASAGVETRGRAWSLDSCGTCDSSVDESELLAQEEEAAEATVDDAIDAIVWAVSRRGVEERVVFLNQCRADGMDVHARRSDGQTFAHRMAYYDLGFCLLWLRAVGVSLDDTDNHGNTPMHYAAYAGALDAIDMLHTTGHDINACIYATPLDVALRNGQSRAAQKLWEYGGRVTQVPRWRPEGICSDTWDEMCNLRLLPRGVY